jgi:CheY-like chemotaxis protein
MARVREMMERQLRHLVRLVDDLLDVSRITLGKVTLKKERIDIRAVVLGALEATRAQIEAKGHELVLQLAPQALFIEGDLTRLTQVIVNLIGNAVRYTPSGGRIEITTAANENEVMVRISDTGIGIPEEMLPRVFDLFTQAHPSSQSSQGGLGLGLTLARGLVEMHGGLISAASAGAGAGSTFSVSLPLGALADAGRTEPQTAVCAARKPLRILVVDDNADAAETVAMLLRMEGHDIRMAHTGESALHLAAQFSPNAVLLDLGLPGLNGYEVARLLRQDAHLPQPLTLIALTGWGSGDDRRAAEAAGFDHHLMKPVAVENLLEALSR